MMDKTLDKLYRLILILVYVGLFRSLKIKISKFYEYNFKFMMCFSCQCVKNTHLTMFSVYIFCSDFDNLKLTGIWTDKDFYVIE